MVEAANAASTKGLLAVAAAAAPAAASEAEHDTCPRERGAARTPARNLGIAETCPANLQLVDGGPAAEREIGLGESRYSAWLGSRRPPRAAGRAARGCKTSVAGMISLVCAACAGMPTHQPSLPC